VGSEPVYGRAGRIGAVIPANNSVIEPEWWSVLPADVAVYATRILARGDLTPDAVHAMESHVDRAVDELAATEVDVIAYCDMVTTFVMEPGWNEKKVDSIAARTNTRAISAWTALRDALEHLGIRRFSLGTPYPQKIHALAPPFFTARGYDVVDEATLDIVRMRDVPKLSPAELTAFVGTLDTKDAQAVVLLATDLPSFPAIAQLERSLGCPVLTSNQTLLWRALHLLNIKPPANHLGYLFDA